MKIGLISLGCSKNTVDSEVMLGAIVRGGHEITNDPSEAEILIVNTCGFIDIAKQESIDTLLEMAEYKEDKCKYLIATGCLIERYIEELPKELPEVDAFVGVGDYHKIDEIIAKLDKDHQFIKEGKSIPFNEYSRVLTTPNHFAYLKIAEGCNHKCSFCAIPMIKGPYKSGEYQAVLKEANRLVEAGAKELILIAQDTTRFGSDYGKLMLSKLLDDLDKIPNLEWIRVLYAYPECVTDELIDAMVRNEKVCRYLDVPIQHISDNILKAMKRSSNKEQIVKLFDKLRKNGFTIRTTLIVGFPGETEDDFNQLYDFVERARIDRLGVFSYSKEEGTVAASMQQIDEQTKQERFDKIMTLQNDISRELNEERIGQKVRVLVEGMDELIPYGRSYAEAPDIDGKVYVEGEDIQIGQFYEVEITQSAQYDIYGVKQ